MTMTLSEQDVRADKHLVLIARLRKLLADLDYKREITRLQARGYTQTQIGQWVGVSQPAIATTEEVPAIIPGFSGATPLEICQRYAAELISRDQLIDELGRYPYLPQDKLNPNDPFDFLVSVEGSWDDVDFALHTQLINYDIYAAVVEIRKAAARAGKIKK